MKLGVPIVWWKGSFSRHPQLFAFAHLPNGQGKANATHLEPGSFGKSNAGVDLPLVVALGGPTHPLPTPTTIHSHSQVEGLVGNVVSATFTHPLVSHMLLMELHTQNKRPLLIGDGKLNCVHFEVKATMYKATTHHLQRLSYNNARFL